MGKTFETMEEVYESIEYSEKCGLLVWNTRIEGNLSYSLIMNTLKWWKGWRLPTLKEFRELDRPGFEGQYWLQLSREETDEMYSKSQETSDIGIIDTKYIKRFIFLVKNINKENESND